MRKRSINKGKSAIIFLTILTLVFYIFYLYVKYSNDRESVSSIYDDENDQLRQPYQSVFTVLVIAGSLFLFVVAAMLGKNAVFPIWVVLVIMVWAVGWVIDHIAALLAGKQARYREMPKIQQTTYTFG